MRSSWHAATTAVVTACQQVLDCDVFDSAPTTADELPAALFVGWQAGMAVDSAAGVISQQPHDAGLPAARMESGEIRCTILAQSGDMEVAPVRERAFDILAQVASIFHLVPTAGGTTRPSQAAQTLLTTWSSITSAQLLTVDVSQAVVTQGNTPRGVYAQIDFTASYEALIT